MFPKWASNRIQIVNLRRQKSDCLMFREYFKRDRFIFGVMITLAVLLYGNTIPNDYSLDDTYVAQNNPKVMKGLAGIPEIFTSRYVNEEGNSFGYRPIAVATFAIEHELWGQNPHMGHLINTLLYALTALLLFTALRKVFRNSGWLFPLVIILFFLAHPIHTEAVTSLKNRETLLSFLFGLVALHCFLKWMESKRVSLILAGTFCFIIAFLSKQDVITFAAIIPLALFYRSSEPIRLKWTGSRLFFVLKSPTIFLSLALLSFLVFYFATRRLGAIPTAILYFSTLVFLILYYRKLKKSKEMVPRKKFSWLFLSLGILFFLAAIFFFKARFALLSLITFAVFFTRLPENVKIRKISMPGIWLTLMISLLILSVAGILFYRLPNLYLPAEDKVVYNFENPQFAGDLSYPTLPLAFYTLWFYLTKLLWPHPLGFYYGYKMIPEVSWTTPEVIFSILFHLGILLFALWKLPRKHILSFAILYYLATISIFSNIVIKIPGIVGERLAFFPSLGFSIALAWGIFKLMGISPEAERIPRNKAVGLSFALLLVLIPYSAKTFTRNRDWKDYLTLFSHDIGYLANSAKANNTYANQLMKEAFNNDVKNPEPAVQKKYLDLAVKHLKRTVEIDSTYKFAWNNLGYITYRYLDSREEGIRYMEKAVQIDSNYELAHFNLGNVYKKQKDFKKSINHFREAQRINPGKMLYFAEEADAWFLSGNRENALTIFEKASEIDLSDDLPLINIGNIYWMSGDTLSAVESWVKAFERNPANLNVCNNLLGYFTRKGDEAKAEYYRSRSKVLELQSPNR